MTPTRRPSYEPNQIVVATPYANLVTSQLQRWDARPRLEETDDRLGLSLVSLAEEAAVHKLRDDRPDEVQRAESSIAEDHGVSTPLDVLLRVLRSQFADRHAGWIPTFGKNRNVERLRGSYVIDGGGTRQQLKLLPQYVIDGGGVAGPTTLLPDQRRVPRRAASPGAGARVGIVDTALYPHPFLAGGYVATSADLLEDGDDRHHPTRNHATFVAGTVVRQAPGALLTVMAGLDAEASSDTWSVARRIADLAAAGVDVVNLSFGCATEDQRPPLVLAAAIRTLPRNVVVVAAAGNHAEPGQPVTPVWPAALDDVVAVGALDGDERADFSPDAPWVDAVAAGTGVVSTCRPEDGRGWFGRWSGTSFAAGTVAGEIAARITPGTTARDAWQSLRDAEDHEGPVVVPLREDQGWPTA